MIWPESSGGTKLCRKKEDREERVQRKDVGDRSTVVFVDQTQFQKSPVVSVCMLGRLPEHRYASTAADDNFTWVM